MADGSWHYCTSRNKYFFTLTLTLALPLPFFYSAGWCLFNSHRIRIYAQYSTMLRVNWLRMLKKLRNKFQGDVNVGDISRWQCNCFVPRTTYPMTISQKSSYLCSTNYLHSAVLLIYITVLKTSTYDIEMTYGAYGFLCSAFFSYHLLFIIYYVLLFFYFINIC
jgi:hypothetical protein